MYFKKNISLKKLSLLVVVLCLAACGDSGESQKTSYVSASKVIPEEMHTLGVPTEPCSLDGLNDNPAQELNLVDDKSKLKLAGWGGDVAEGISPDSVWVQLLGSDSYYIKAVPGGERLDVANYFKKPGLSNTGWTVNANLSELKPGNYQVKIIMNIGQRGLVCDTKRNLKIK